MADLRGRKGRAPPGSKFFRFHAVFGKNWQNRMLAPPRGVGAPSSGKSWIRHCSLWYIYCIPKTFCIIFQTKNDSLLVIHFQIISKETIHIISLHPISKKRTPKSIHCLSVVSLWMNVIGTFWRETTRELIHIVWLDTKIRNFDGLES